MDVTGFCCMILSILVKIGAVIPVTQPGWILRASPAEAWYRTTGPLTPRWAVLQPAPGFSLASTRKTGSGCRFRWEKLSSVMDQVAPPKSGPKN